MLDKSKLHDDQNQLPFISNKAKVLSQHKKSEKENLNKKYPQSFHPQDISSSHFPS